MVGYVVCAIFLLSGVCWAGLSEKSTGVIVEQVEPNSPAARAGLKPNDRLISYDGKPITSPAFLQAMSASDVGKAEVVLEVQRGEERLQLTVPAGELGIWTRPDLPPAVLQAYEAGRSSLASNKEVTIDKWQEAVRKAQENGDNESAAWLWLRIGEVYEEQNRFKDAETAYEEAVKVYKRIPSREVDLAHALNRAGSMLRIQGNLEKAREYFSCALEIYERRFPNSLDVGKVITNLGVVALGQGDLQKAHDLLVRSLQVFDRLAPVSIQIAVALNCLGTVSRERDDLQKAEEYYSRALDIFKQLAPDTPGMAGTLNDLGTVLYRKGDLQKAEEYYSRALEIFQQRFPDSLWVASVLNNLGLVAMYRGNLVGAQEYFNRTLALFQRLIPDSIEVAGAFNNLGIIADELGDTQKAQEYLNQALAIHERIAPNSLNAAETMVNLGANALDMGDLERARDYYVRALAITERVAPESLIVATILMNLGSTFRRSGDLAKAEEYTSRALAIAQRLAPESGEYTMSLSNLGLIALERGELGKAQELFNQALNIHERTAPDSLDFAAALYHLGLLAQRRGDWQSAQRYHARALTIEERLVPDTPRLADSLYNLALIAVAQKRYNDAMEYLSRAVQIIEAQRRRIPSSETRMFFTIQYARIYSLLMRTCLDLEDWAGAYHTLERARARSLVEMLVERDIDFAKDVPQELLQKQQDLDRQRVLAYRELSQMDPQKDGELIEALRRRITRYASEQRSLTEQIRRASPRYAALQYPQPVDAKEAQNLLEPGTLALVYWVDSEETILFALTRDDLKVYRLPLAEKDLRSLVERFRLSLAQRRDFYPQAINLYQTLLRPAEAQIDRAKRLLLCPDGILHQLPFGALVRGSGRHKGQYLVEWKPVHQIASLSLFAELRKQKSNGRSRHAFTLLALGDPAYETGSPTGKQKAQKLAKRGVKLEPLPATRQEVEAIGKLYGKSAAVYVGTQATETVLKREGARARMVHIACHGLLDSRDPMVSALALSPEGENDDGFMYAYEVLTQMRLDADLVVLSACQSGLGEEMKQEGIIGLTRAFQYAGARSVVVSLWEIMDVSTKELMTRFYQELKRGLSKDEALRRAQVQMIRSPQYSHPYYWAGFVLVGSRQ